ncbi:MAG: DUF1853 family protein [Pseudomonadota bacterium]|nr:DUF1853 family protein [Pseudomonadota bacterium]
MPMSDVLAQYPALSTEAWLSFCDPIVRALAFVIASPSLIHAWPATVSRANNIELPTDAFWQRQLIAYWPRLCQLDQNPRPLHHALQLRPNLKLGHYFEDLLGFWLADEGWHEFVLIEQGLQRMDGKRTLGELDFLVENLETGQIEHWEVCLKFYLGEGSLKPAEWVGLQRKDTLGRKLHHLQQQQFAVRSIQGLRIDHRRAVIKGRLFWPNSANQQSLATMHEIQAWLSPTALRGTWADTPPSRSALPHSHHWRRAHRLEWVTEQAEPIPTTLPQYWTNGLYFQLTQDHHIVERRMLRLRTPTLQLPYRHNV